jgi:UDP-N-acetylglucosamine acyltransferase
MISDKAFISDRVNIGKDCKIYNFASIGNPPQWKGCYEDIGNPIIIGDNVEIREFVTINTPTIGTTFIGSNCLLMANSHIGHDTVIENGVSIGVGAALSGFTFIGAFSYLGLNSTTHQKYVFPSYSCLGANSFFKSDIAVPGLIWVGCPAEPVKVNIIGIERNVEDIEERKRLIENASEFLGNYSSRRSQKK